VTAVYFLPTVFMQVPYIQRKVSTETASYLEKKLGGKVEIGSVGLDFFNMLVLKNVLIQDQASDTLFSAKRIGARIEFIPLFYGKLRFYSAQMFSFHLNLSRETVDSPINIQYIIDAFQSENEENSSPINLKIKTLRLRLGNFTYRIKDQKPTPGIFNPNDIELNRISAKIKLKNFSGNDLDIFLNKLSFNEKSGITLKSLSFDLKASADSIKTDKLNLELPCTNLQISDIKIDYDKNKALNDIPFHFQVQPSDICLQDFSALIPDFSHYEDIIILNGGFSGTLSNFSFKNFSVQADNDFLVRANGNIQNATKISNPEQIYIKSQISESHFNILAIQNIINNLNGKEMTFPYQIKNLGNILFNGDLSGYINNLQASGKFNTDLGKLTANVVIGKKQNSFIKGSISTEQFNLRKLIGNEDFGQTAFNIVVDAVLNKNKSNPLSGNIDGKISLFEYKGYNYENVLLTGDFTPSGFNGTLIIDNPDVKLTAKGSAILNGNDSEFNFSAHASNVHIGKLNLVKKYQNPILSFFINAKFKGNEIDNFLGNININDLSFSTKTGVYRLNSFAFQANMQDETKEIKIISDIINGEIKGVYSLKNITSELKQVLSAYLPSLFAENTISDIKNENNFSLNFIINNDEELASILELPFSLRNQSTITGSYNNQDNELKLSADIPYIKAGGLVVEAGKLELHGENDCASLNINGNLRQKNDILHANASFIAENNYVNSVFSWNNINSRKNAGQLKFTTSLSDSGKKSWSAFFDVKQSQMIFNDSVWTIYPTTITASADNIQIEDLRAHHGSQLIEIQGNISRESEEQVYIELNHVDLSYIFNTLSIKALDFGGIATGKVYAKDVYNTCQLTTHLDVTDFAFNKEVFGHLLLDGSWDNELQGIRMEGNISNHDTATVAIDGMIFPLKEEISIFFDARNATAAFLRKYLNNVVQDISGQVTGRLHLFGDLNHPTIEGSVDVKYGSFRIKFLNTCYTFSDRVICTPDKIYVENLTLFDDKKHKSTVNAYVTHRLFDDFKFSANIDFENFLVFNATKTSNPALYGTAFGSGKMTLKGTEDLVNINISMQNTENSKITLNFMEEMNVAEYDFIHFVNNKKDSLPANATQQYLPVISNKPVYLNNSSRTEIRLALSLEINPQASVDLIINPISGDKISTSGNGRLDIQYGTSLPLKVLGNYTIEKGKYNFTLQQVFIRNFDIKEGSSILFKGNPYFAELDVNAAYTISANLGDLDERLLAMSARDNVPVNCILILKGLLSHPDISFDLSLPNATSELVRQVKSYIRTDDMMNRQILYLLVLGRFYTSPEYLRTDSRLNNDLSFLTSTLSSQLSSILGNLSNNFQIGTAFHQAYDGEKSRTEIELLLSSTILNNRLTINGNLGYSNNPIFNDENGSVQNTGAIPVVGDLDVEYKLTPSGNIRLKGFNHYNYRNYYSITPELTQGIGILFRKNFNSFRYLFKDKDKKE
jgi:hypothetical protein